MRSLILPILMGMLLLSAAGQAKERFERDVFKTPSGDLAITFIGHGTLMLTYAGKVIHVDPVSKEADYSKLPKADLVLVTHEHFDHLDPKAIAAVRTEKTNLVISQSCTAKVKGGLVMKNGDERTVSGVKIKAVPAYNLVHKRPDGKPFHPKGVGNGYLLTLADKVVYIAGDTENIPEMKALKGIDIAFLPMNLPYTMTPAMVADAARAFKPRVLYPYHYGKTDTGELLKLMRGVSDVEIRIRQMQ